MARKKVVVTTFRVTAAAAGSAACSSLTDRRRAGEAWPRGAAREVVVLDQVDDPPGRQLEGAFAIGQKTLAILKADRELTIESISPAAVWIG